MRTRSRRKPLSHYLWGKNLAHKITTYFGNKICCPRTHLSSMNPAKWIKICILLYLWSVNWIIKCEWQTIINTFRQFSYYPVCRIKYVKNIIKFLSIYKKDLTRKYVPGTLEYFKALIRSKLQMICKEKIKFTCHYSQNIYSNIIKGN